MMPVVAVSVWPIVGAPVAGAVSLSFTVTATPSIEMPS